ncbi:hypothetical protein ACXM1Q_001915 [Streptococcus sp. 10F2]
MLATVFAFFGISDWTEANRITLFEFRIRNRGHIMSQLEHEKNLHLQAFLNRLVKATTKDGKEYKFKDFRDFYDEKKRWNEKLGKNHSVPVNENLIAIAKRMQNYKKGGY